jgi:hypothetical protein
MGSSCPGRRKDRSESHFRHPVLRFAMAARIWCLSALLSVFPLADAVAGTEVDASPPVETRVTIYRAKGDDTSLAVGSNLDGYALISETREVDVPAGSATIRFPGVAAGMLAESAVVTGLPVGVREKNLDAALLSPGRLYGGWYGRPVMVRRHDPKTGRLREEGRDPLCARRRGGRRRQEVRSAQLRAVQGQPCLSRRAAGPVIFSTLSVATDAPSGAHARVTLSYLAWNFDWRADYGLDLEADRRHAMLNAWVTLASGDVTSFVGRRPRSWRAIRTSMKSGQTATKRTGAHSCSGVFLLLCLRPRWSLRLRQSSGRLFRHRRLTSLSLPCVRVVAAKMEDLGDLKLYRLPLPTTVAARGKSRLPCLPPSDCCRAGVDGRSRQRR